jgi:6-phospho-beta-glucosidase
VLAADDFNAIRNWAYLDLPVRGIYNSTYLAYLARNDAMPDISPGDMDELASAKPDFVAFNYYSSPPVKNPAVAPLACAAISGQAGQKPAPLTADQQTAAGEAGLFEAAANPYLQHTQFGWEMDPAGFRLTARALWDRYRLPLLVTENGLGAFDELVEGQVNDTYRIDYLRAHIAALREAIDDGVQVIGYCPWSAIDLVSTHQGVAKRYGFIYVNRTDTDLLDLARLKKASFNWYRDVIASNGRDI